VNLIELSKNVSKTVQVPIESLGVDLRIKRLSLQELQEVDRLIETCSTGSGKNRTVTNLPKLVHVLLKRFITDAEGNPHDASVTEEDVAQLPGSVIAEIMAAYRKINGGEEPDPN